MTDETTDRLRVVRDKAIEAWRALKDDKKNIPPKVHLLADHVVDVFIELGGLGDFDESFVERNHQRGKRPEL